MKKSKEKSTQVITEPVDWKEVWHEILTKQKGLLAGMVLVIFLSLILLILTLLNLNVQNMQVVVGYSDVHGGYQKGGWASMIMFGLLALVCGVLHNVLAVKVYKKYGKDSALVLVFATVLVLLGAFVVFFRVLGAR